MLRIIVNKNDNIERALKKFKNKFNRCGVAKEIKERQQFVKKSEKKRNQKNKAIYINKMKNDEKYN